MAQSCSVRQRRPQGLSLIECLVAVSIAALTFTGLFVPLTASVLVQRQEKPLGEALNLARLELEFIRSRWSLAANYNRAGAFTVPIDQVAWPNASVSAVSMAALAASPTWTSGQINASEVRPDHVSGGGVTGFSGIRSATVAIPRGGTLNDDYVAQILVGMTPGIGNDRSRRVVIRVFAATRNAQNSLVVDPAITGAQTTRRNSLIASSGSAVASHLTGGALAILITDIAAP